MIFLSLLLQAAVISQPVFGVAKKGDVWWFKDTHGAPFWSFAVDCVGPGQTQKEYDPKNPGYAGYRLYDSPQRWAKVTFSNLKSWGFNSLGGWSDVDYIAKNAADLRLPYFEVLHLGAYAEAPFHDIFAESARAAMHKAAQDQILKLRTDPKLAGYFTDNELGWWGDTLFLSYLAMKPDTAGKQRIMDLIRHYYHGDFNQLQVDWITNSNSFDEISAGGTVKLRPGGNGIHLVNTWLAEMARYYYQFVHDTVREFDKDRLILGDRYCQFYELPIAAASRPYIDVASTNFGATWNDGTFVHFFLDGLHELTGKPIVISEFYMGAFENRSGNKNTPPAFPVVQTQRQRAAAYLTNVRDLAKLPYVIGAHWFQYYDEPPKGRGDGENFNHGLVDTMGRPYEEMASASQASRPAEVHANSKPAFVPSSVAVPLAPSNPLRDLKLWPRDKGYIAPAHGTPFADIYVCKDSKALYLGLIAMDYVDPHLYEDNRLPESERMQWTIQLDGVSKPIHLRLGAGQNSSCDLQGSQVAEWPGLQHTALIRIPVDHLPPKFRLRSAVITHSRGFQMTWDKELTASK